MVLPVFNERGHLLQEIQRLKTSLGAWGHSYEIIVVDDGSTDGSAEDLAGDQDLRLIRFTRNKGTGAARRAGTQAARGRWVAWTDADMTYPNDQIPRLVKELEGHDQVVGARTSEQGTVKLLRTPAKWILRKLAGYLMKTDIPDLNSGLRVFRKDVAAQFLHMLPSGFSCVSTLTLSFLSNGYSVKYVPIEYAPRSGKSKFHWYGDTKKYLTQIVRMVLSYEPLRVFLPVGVSLGVLGMVKMGFDWATKDFRLATNTLLLLFAAFQTLSIGFLADLLVRLNKPRDQVEPESN